MPWKVRLIFRVDLTNVMKTSECHLQQIQDWKPNDFRIETFYNHSPYRLFGVVSDKTSVGPRKDPRLSHQCRWKWLRIMAQALFSEMVKGTFCLPWQALWVWVWKWRMIALICPDVWQCSQCCRDNDPMILISGKPICAWGFFRSVIQWVQDPGHQKPTYTSKATKMYWLSKAQTIPNSA